MENHNTNGADVQQSASDADELDATKVALFGDKLTQAIDALGHEINDKTIGDYSAALLGRVTSILNAVELRMLAALEAARNVSG